MGYFAMWEDCKGPNQSPVDCNQRSERSRDTNYKAPIQNMNMLDENNNKLEEKTEKLPSTIEMARNFMGSAAKHLANGMKAASEELQQERLSICEKCPHIVEDGSRCGKCGCFLQTKAKWASSSCPIGKW